MKRTASIIAAALLMVGASAGAASAANDYGSQPGYPIAMSNTGIANSTLCGQPHN